MNENSTKTSLSFSAHQAYWCSTIIVALEICKYITA